MSITVSLLADSMHCVDAVAKMRHREWGHAPEPEDLGWWRQTTIDEAGRDALPVTFVANDADGKTLGAVGLDHYDLDERRDTTPWVTGMIVARDRRLAGVGRVLMEHLEQWAADHGITEGWVGTDLALAFYQRCGWVLLESFTTGAGEHMDVLHKHLV